MSGELLAYKKTNKIGILFLLVLFLFCLIKKDVHAQKEQLINETKLLLSRLENDTPELNTIKKEPSSIEAAKELLLYFKKRAVIKHPAQFTKDLIPSEKDWEYADNALKHVFVGQTAYAPYFCGEDINWASSPVPDNEWVWQLNRMYFWNSMAKVYAKSEDEKYAEEWSTQLIHWVKNNPRDEAHKYAWRSIEAGIRGKSWTDLFFRFIQSEHFDEETLVYFLNSLYDHAEFLMTVYGTKSNWGLMEAEGMAFIAITFPEFKAATKWREEAFRRLNNEINLQVYPDGHQRELAMGYHIGCINWFYRTYELAKLNGLENAFPDSYFEKIERMCEVPMKIGLPDGTNAQFGDAWQGKPQQYADKFLEWAKMFNRKDFLYLGTEGQSGHKPDSTAYALQQSGLYSMRSSWDKNAVCLVLKCGPDGGFHCQPDNGTFTLYAGGVNLMPDGGSYIYHGDPEGRKWFRQTKVHQTLTLNGEDSDYAPKLLKWQHGNDLDILVVENESYENLIHRRSVFFIDKRYFVIVDEAFGGAKGDIDIHFQMAPGKANFKPDDLSVFSDNGKEWNVLVRSSANEKMDLSEEEGWVSFQYTKKQPRPAFRYRIKKELNNQRVCFVRVVAPFKDVVPNIKANLIGDTKTSNAGLRIRVEENGRKKEFEYSL